MPRRWRNILIGIVVAIVAVELVLNLASPPSGLVEITNQGTTPMDGVVARFQGREISLGTVPPGATTRFVMSGRRKGVLTLSYRQKSSALSGIELDDFDPPELASQGLKVVLVVQDIGYQRYGEDHPSGWARAWQRFADWLGEL